MNETIDDFAHDGDTIVALAARTTQKLKEAHDAGKLSDDEFDELVRDTLILGRVQESMISLDRKEYILVAFKRITSLLGLSRLL